MRTEDPQGESTALAVMRISMDVILITLAVLAIFVVTTKSFYFGRSLFYVDPAEEAPGTDVEITIYEGESYESLGERLYEQGIVSDALSFRVQATLYKTSLYPGTYTVNTSGTIREILLGIDEDAGVLESEAEALRASEAMEEDYVAAGYEGESAQAESTVEAEAEAAGAQEEIISGGSEGD